MSRVLVAAGHDVVSTDLIDRGYGEAGVDFLTQTEGRGRNIITNPLFKHAEAFVTKALELAEDGGKVAILCRLAWLEGMGRKQRLFDVTPPARVWVFSRRLFMSRGGLITFAWYVWFW